MVLVVAIVIADSGVHVLSSKVRKLHIYLLYLNLLNQNNFGSYWFWITAFFLSKPASVLSFPNMHRIDISIHRRPDSQGEQMRKRHLPMSRFGETWDLDLLIQICYQTALVNGHHFHPDRILGL